MVGARDSVPLGEITEKEDDDDFVPTGER